MDVLVVEDCGGRMAAAWVVGFCIGAVRCGAVRCSCWWEISGNEKCVVDIVDGVAKERYSLDTLTKLDTEITTTQTEKQQQEYN